MSITNGVLVVVALVVFGCLISKRIRSNRGWSATITPLASIIGSGFLVSVPLLATSMGIWSIPAVIGLTTLAFLIGGVVRYNIRNGEEVFKKART